MSDDNKTDFDIDNKNQVVITPEDMQECTKFFQFFEIPMDSPLHKAIEAFQKDPSLQNQKEIRYQLSEVIVRSQHPVFRDEVFNQVRPETAEINEGLVFERQLEEQLTGDTDE